MGTVLAGRVYDAHTLSNTNRCMGPECFRLTFLITGSLCFLAMSMLLIIVKKTLPFYKPAHSHKAIHAGDEIEDSSL